MRPGVVTQLHLTGIDHGPQRGGVDRPRTVGAVDEKHQPGAAVTAEVGERAHHLRAGAVVNGQRQLIAIPGKPGKHAGWWPLSRETTRGRGATGRRENADRNAAQQPTAIYLPHISTLLEVSASSGTTSATTYPGPQWADVSAPGDGSEPVQTATPSGQDRARRAATPSWERHRAQKIRVHKLAQQT